MCEFFIWNVFTFKLSFLGNKTHLIKSLWRLIIANWDWWAAISFRLCVTGIIKLHNWM